MELASCKPSYCFVSLCCRDVRQDLEGERVGLCFTGQRAGAQAEL